MVSEITAAFHVLLGASPAQIVETGPGLYDGHSPAAVDALLIALVRATQQHHKAAQIIAVLKTKDI